jgi:hypothetical protein
MLYTLLDLDFNFFSLALLLVLQSEPLLFSSFKALIQFFLKLGVFLFLQFFHILQSLFLLVLDLLNQCLALLLLFPVFRADFINRPIVGNLISSDLLIVHYFILKLSRNFQHFLRNFDFLNSIFRFLSY